MKDKQYASLAFVSSIILLWVFMIVAGIVHSFLPIVPAIGFWQIVVLNLFIGIAKILIFGFPKQK